MALLHGLSILAPRLSISLHAACVDHGLRPESATEAALVVERCKAMAIPCSVVRVDLKPLQRPHHSLQTLAREARLEGLLKIADQMSCNAVALGHHANDQAETVLFRILRGTGITGLAGIPYRRDRLIRPLLDVWRHQIVAFLNKRKIPYFSDPSNDNRRFTRVRIRHDLMPLLARENPKLAEALCALAKSARTASSPKPVLIELPKDVYLTRRTRERLTELIQSGHGTQRLDIPGGTLEVRYGHVTLLSSQHALKAEHVEFSQPQLISRPEDHGVKTRSGSRLFVRNAKANELPHSILFDANLLTWPLSLRYPQPGDRMRPRNGAGRRKLSDLFIDAKIPRDERAFLPVLCDGSGEILYVSRLRPSEFARPTHGSSLLIAVEEAR
jgi:tRNA(Ile)-lysidine synthase